jgi:hypothetical protein
MRFVFPAALAGLIYWIQRSKPPTDLKEKLAAVRPLSDTECPYCKGALDREGHCAACQVTHRRILNYQRGE